MYPFTGFTRVHSLVLLVRILVVTKPLSFLFQAVNKRFKEMYLNGFIQQDSNKTAFANETRDIFPHDDTPFNYINFVILVCLIPCILSGNLLMIVAICRFRKLRTCTNLLLGNLALSDLLVGFPTAPIYGAMYMSADLYRSKWLCLVKCTAVTASLSSTLIGLAVISVERYLSVFYPLHYSSWVTKKRIQIAILITWIYVIPVSLTLSLFGITSWNQTSVCDIFELIPKPFIITAHIVTIGICFPISFILYLLITCEIRKVRRSKKSSMSKTYKQQRVRSDTQRKEGLMMAGIFLLFVIFWLPSTIAIPLKYILPGQNVIENIKNLSVVIAMGNSVVNPVVFCWCKEELKVVFNAILFCKGDTSHYQSTRTTLYSRRHQSENLPDIFVI